jgi:CheY-like chemotaxis protein
MAAGLAHEIRNPLAGMEILTGLLRRRLQQQPEELALVSELTAEIRRVAQTVTDSLEFVRPMELRRDPVDPVEVLEESLARARSRVPLDVDIQRDYAETLLPLRADGERLESVLTNLIVNAFEAMLGAASAPARVSLGVRVEAALVEAPCERAPGRAGLHRRRHGSRHSDELRERVFYPFFTTNSAARASASRRPEDRRRPRRPPRTQQRVRPRLDLRVRSAALRRKHARRRRGRPREPAARFLVVEDNDTLRRGIARALADGFGVADEEPAGDTAVARLRDPAIAAYDVIVTDLRLPGAGGLEVLEAARIRDARSAVILMTAYGTIESAVEAMRRGAFDFPES